MAASVDFKTYVDQACRAAEEFVNIYYETMDKRRRALTRLYLDKATLIWNGNAVSGQEALNEFFEMLPSSEFQVNVLDCQPVHGFVKMAAVSGTAPRYRTAAALTSLTAHTWCAYGLPGKNIQVGILFKETTTTQITFLKLHNKAQKNNFISQTSKSSKCS
ncbi:NTF2-related export protein 2 isoform X1 [Phasianus colchicus]|uniref:NTF2-related export protein 2 isoform X1 n=1 Tax=Phasianus colchicus TaxID=9054 RepID=UPI00129E7813|nr:NTF2-related export protein 2 isoform X1 [Phasianus colchicus]